MNTRESLAVVTGLSTRMLSDLEKARRTNFDPGALARIEIALHWQPGSFDSVLAGGEPIERPGLEHDPDGSADQAVVIDTMPGGLLHVSTLLWARICDLADLSVARANDEEVRQAARAAVFVTADVLTDLLLASPDAKASKELLQEMFATATRYEESRRQSPHADALTSNELLSDDPQPGPGPWGPGFPNSSGEDPSVRRDEQGG